MQLCVSEEIIRANNIMGGHLNNARNVERVNIEVSDNFATPMPRVQLN